MCYSSSSKFACIVNTPLSPDLQFFCPKMAPLLLYAQWSHTKKEIVLKGQDQMKKGMHSLYLRIRKLQCNVLGRRRHQYPLNCLPPYSFQCIYNTLSSKAISKSVNVTFSMLMVICTCGYTVKVFSRQAVDLSSFVFRWAFTINLFHRGVGFI